MSIERIRREVTGQGRDQRDERELRREHASPKMIGNLELQENRTDHPQDRSPEMREQHARRGEWQRGGAGEGHIERAHDEKRRPDRSPEARRLLAENPSERDGPETGAE